MDLARHHERHPPGQPDPHRLQQGAAVGIPRHRLEAVPHGEVQVVDPLVRQQVRHRQLMGQLYALDMGIVFGGEAHPDQKFPGQAGADAAHYLHQDPRPVGDAAAPAVGATIVQGVEEVAEQEVVGPVQLDPVQAGGMGPLGGAHEGFNERKNPLLRQPLDPERVAPTWCQLARADRRPVVQFGQGPHPAVMQLHHRQRPGLPRTVGQGREGLLLGVGHQGRLPRPAASAGLYLGSGGDEQAEAAASTACQPVELGLSGIAACTAHVVGQRGQHGPVFEPQSGPFEVEAVAKCLVHRPLPGSQWNGRHYKPGQSGYNQAHKQGIHSQQDTIGRHT